jgi:hypothetical protein
VQEHHVPAAAAVRPPLPSAQGEQRTAAGAYPMAHGWRTGWGAGSASSSSRRA